LFGQRSNYVVSLITIQFNYWYIKSGNDALNIRNSIHQVLGRFLPIRFVIGEISMSLSRRICIKTNRHVRWLLIIHQVNQGGGKSELRIGIPSFAGNTGIAYQRVICAENKR